MHEFQHADEPTWCLHCGTFKENCGGEPCPKAGQRLFDGNDAQTGARMIGDLFGLELRETGQGKLFEEDAK
jgi:hypothetical protein